VVGKLDEQQTAALLNEIRQRYLPNSILQWVQPGEALESISPLLKGKSQIAGKPTVYVCENFTCSAPVTSWSELKPLLEN